MSSIPNSVRIAGVILLALVAYFVIRGVMRPAPEPADTETAQSETPEETMPEVVVRAVTPELHAVTATLKGRTEPDRTVTVRSETTGTVTRVGAREGQYVQAGAVLCELGIESRAARIAEAQAAVDAARLDHEAARSLETKGWTSSNRAAATKAALDRAEAGLASAKIELEKTKIRAPFGGIFETRMAEAGDFLSPGAACGEIVDLSPIVVAVDATEEQMVALNVGASVDVSLASGPAGTGKIRYIARTANPQTRTFRAEIALPNPKSKIAAGLTASARINLGEAPAVLLTPASLVLHDDGRVGVRYVGEGDVIQFTEVTVIDDAAGGVWVTGLPEGARLLSAGQDYLREGIKVTTISAEGL